MRIVSIFAAALFTSTLALGTAGCAVDSAEEEGDEDVANVADEVKTKAALVGHWRRTTKPLDGVQLHFRQDGSLGVLLMTVESRSFFVGSYTVANGKLDLRPTGDRNDMRLTGTWGFGVDNARGTLTLSRDGKVVYVFKRV